MAEAKVCAIDECSNKQYVRGLCTKHYRSADFRPDCAVDGCSKKVAWHGLCLKHQRRRERNGGTDAVKRNANGTYDAWIEDNQSHDGDACLIWPFWRDKQGYGPIRKMCAAAHGASPTPKHQAAHSCGNGHKGCINPRHLRWATLSENRRDMVDHGRSLRGEKHPLAKLTEGDVVLIKKADPSINNAEVGRMFGVSRETVRGIRSGKSWGWL